MEDIFDVMLNMVNEWSDEDHTLLDSARTEALWAVASSSDVSAKSSKQKAKERMMNIELPEVATFDSIGC